MATASQKVLWQPSAPFINQSNLKKFENWLNEHQGLQFPSYQELWQWSVDQPEAFWEAIWNYFQVKSYQPYRQVLSQRQMPGARWFEGATLNYAEHLFRHKAEGKTALIFQNEKGRKDILWENLEAQVLRLQQYLRQKGIGEGDRVAAYLPNVPEAIAAFMAVNSLGAVWSCCSPDFGVETVIDRFSQIEPALLLATDGYTYNGKEFSKMEEVEKIRSGIPSIRQTLFVPTLNPAHRLENSDNWFELMEEEASGPLSFTPVLFNHPMWVLYSSGTTGRPKAITHSHGGVLLEHLKYMAFHNDVKAGENFFWFTTTGWMMWNFLQASLLMGATPVLYDGSPGYPDLDVLWQMAEDLPLHHFGTSAPYLTACMKKGMEPGKKQDLSALRSIGSTGAPLPPEAFEWVYSAVKEDLWLCSMSGGTDVCTAFVGGNPYLPVYKGAIQSRALGCALYAYDEMGNRVGDELGEMVIEKALPSMPIYFWGDEDNKRYLSSYFEDYPGKWRHGDWIHIFDNGSLIIQGRSDATLNRKGVRIGTAEIYNVLDKMPSIKDALILNIEQEDGGDHMPLFVVMQEGQSLSPEIIGEIKSQLKTKGSPRHVPDEVIEVPDIPYTLSGKKMEVPVKKILMGMDISKTMNRDAMRNPEAMDYFLKLTEKGN